MPLARPALVLLAGLLSFPLLPARAAAQPPQPPAVPVTGKAHPLMEPIDRAVLSMLHRHGIPGASLAIARGGKLIHARGYGYAEVAANRAVQPDTRFGIASLSKSITAIAVLKLVEQGKLSLDDKAFQLLKHIRPAPGARVDPRVYEITVRQLLNHTGGWDSRKGGDPVNWSVQTNIQRGGRGEVTPEQLIALTLAVPLDCDPGTEFHYSNFGYVVLGELIEKASGRPYEAFVREHVLAPAGVKSAALHPLDRKYFPNEARRYLAGTDDELPPWQQKTSDAAGGWTASAIDLVRLLTALDGSRGKPLLGEKTFPLMYAAPPPPLRPFPSGTHVGLGWDAAVRTDAGFGYLKDGNWHGMRTFMKRSPDGVNWALLFNASMQPDPTDARSVGDAVKEVRDALERAGKHPEADLFPDFN